MKISQKIRKEKCLETLKTNVTGKGSMEISRTTRLKCAPKQPPAYWPVLSVSCRAKNEQHRVHEEGRTGDVARLEKQEELDWSIIIILSCRDKLSGGGNFDNTPK